MIRPIAKIFLPTNESQIRLYDDPDSDDWNNYVMNGEKVTKYNDKLVFKIIGEIVTLKRDVLKKVSNFKNNTKDSPDAKLNIDFMDEIRFDIHSRGKTLRNINVIKDYCNERGIWVIKIRENHFSSRNSY